MPSKIIIVANRLPVSVSQTAHGLVYKPSPGGLAAALSPALREKTTVWVGYAGINRRLDEHELAELGLPAQLKPVNVEAARYKHYYYGFANGTLWPVFHGFEPRRVYDEADWEATLAVTRQFAEKVAAVASPGDRIWVHDYQLVMLPKALRELGLTNKVGFFLHVPFAEPEFLARLPHAKEILDSLVTADECGVQTEGDRDRFAACLRELGGPATYVERVGVFPVGIDYETYYQAHTRPVTQEKTAELKERLAGKTVILSLSRLDYTKGILEQLEAVELLVAAAPDPGRFLYKLVVAPSREDLVEYSDLKHEIAARVKAINHRLGRPGHPAVDYEYHSLPLDELCAWYARADVMLVTPLRDGQNLIAKEYIAARTDDTGVLVLSETAGAARQMTEAVLVDARRPAAIREGLEQALAMPVAERRRRSRALRAAIKAADALHWARSFDQALREAPR